MNIDILVTLGKQIRRTRTDVAMSQLVLAERCDIFRTYLSRIECGRANPSIGVLARIANELQVDIGTLFLEIEEEDTLFEPESAAVEVGLPGA